MAKWITLACTNVFQKEFGFESLSSCLGFSRGLPVFVPLIIGPSLKSKTLAEPTESVSPKTEAFLGGRISCNYLSKVILKVVMNIKDLMMNIGVSNDP